EPSFIRSDIADANSHILMLDFAVPNETVNRRPYDLRRNRKSHTGERAAGRNQKCVDAYDFAASIDQWPTRVTLIDRRVGLNELTRRSPVFRKWIGTIQRADDTASYGKA